LLALGVWHLEGRYIRRDLSRSRELFAKAGELGDETAEHVFICFLANGVGGTASWEEAKNRLRRLAGHNDRAASQIALIDGMPLTSEGDPLEQPEARQVSQTPEAWVFESFLTPEECDYLVEAARPLLQESVVVDPASGEMRPHPVRTSDGAMFPWVSEDLVISAINRRIALASGTSVKCGEPLQVLRYLPGQQYHPHLDALPREDNQRVLTMLVYLNEGYQGGETYFTRGGLRFAAKRGDALLFRNAEPGSPPDPNAEHAGLPVISGEKFIASRWIRERPLG
jgi:prolyl 4-hydroxylase